MTATVALQELPASEAQAATSRIVWLDAARGFGMLAVVVCHTLGGILSSDLRPLPAAFPRIMFPIYMFAVPLFFLLSGVLVKVRLARNPVGFRQSLWPTLIKPYFIWSAVQLSVVYAMQSFVNYEINDFWYNIISLPWNPPSPFWFLHTLFTFHLFSLLILPRLGSLLFATILFGLRFLPLMVELPPILNIFCIQAIYYAIGVVVGTAGLTTAIADRTPAFRVALLLIATAIVVGYSLQAPRFFNAGVTFDTATPHDLIALGWNLVMVPATLAGVAGAIAFCSLAQGPVAAFLSFLGRRSMPIFLLHVLGVAGTRIILTKLLGVDAPWVVGIAALMVGIFGPLLAAAVLDRLGLAKPLALV